MNTTTRERFFARCLDVVVLIGLYSIYLSLFDYTLAVTKTNVAGGDMISHPAILEALKENLLKGRFWGWNHGWFGGFPFLYFYFCPIYFLAFIFTLFGITQAVAFKIMVLCVVGALPAAYYLSARMVLKKPLAFLFASLALAVFLNEFDSRWGGNFKSLLAGQISHQFGLMWLVVLFFSLQRSGSNSILSVLSLSLAVLSHVYSGLFAAALVVLFVGSETFQKKDVGFAIKSFYGPLLALLMTAFFWVPFAWYRNYTVAPINRTDVSFEELLRVLQISNPLHSALYAATIVSFVYCCINKKIKPFHVGLAGLLALSILMIPLSKGTPILHIRLPAEIYLLFVFLVVLCLHQFKPRPNHALIIYGLFGILIIQSVYPSQFLDKVLPPYLRQPVRDLPTWWRWNMSGIEAKEGVDQVLDVWKALRNINSPEARVAVEYDDYNNYGSPRIFEMTPVMSGKPVIEGLLMESSSMYPTYFFMMLHINPSTWWPGFPLEYPEQDTLKGIKYFSLFNVKYFVAHGEFVKNELEAANFEKIYFNQEFSIFKINDDSRIANRIEGQISVVESREPLMETIKNYPRTIEEVIEIKKGTPGLKIDDIKAENQKWVPLEGHWSDDGQSYIVMNTGATFEKPANIFFKIPYFPNWKANSGEAVSLVTPNMMMVKTRQPSLILTYSPGLAEVVSGFTSLIGLICLIVTHVLARRYRPQTAK